MTTISRLAGALTRSWTDGGPAARIAYVVGASLFLSGLVHLAVPAVSGGMRTGPVSLRKPATSGLSFGLTLATVAWVTHLVPMPARTRAVRSR